MFIPIASENNFDTNDTDAYLLTTENTSSAMRNAVTFDPLTQTAINLPTIAKAAATVINDGQLTLNGVNYNLRKNDIIFNNKTNNTDVDSYSIMSGFGKNEGTRIFDKTGSGANTVVRIFNPGGPVDGAVYREAGTTFGCIKIQTPIAFQPNMMLKLRVEISDNTYGMATYNIYVLTNATDITNLSVNVLTNDVNLNGFEAMGVYAAKDSANRIGIWIGTNADGSYKATVWSGVTSSLQEVIVSYNGINPYIWLDKWNITLVNNVVNGLQSDFNSFQLDAVGGVSKSVVLPVASRAFTADVATTLIDRANVNNLNSNNGTNTIAALTTNGANSIRMKNGTTPSVILRNDGSNFYTLLTNNNDPDGSWNNMRPLTISLSSGQLQYTTPSYGYGGEVATKAYVDSKVSTNLAADNSGYLYGYTRWGEGRGYICHAQRRGNDGRFCYYSGMATFNCIKIATDTNPPKTGLVIMHWSDAFGGCGGGQHSDWARAEYYAGQLWGRNIRDYFTFDPGYSYQIGDYQRGVTLRSDNVIQLWGGHNGGWEGYQSNYVFYSNRTFAIPESYLLMEQSFESQMNVDLSICWQYDNKDMMSSDSIPGKIFTFDDNGNVIEYTNASNLQTLLQLDNIITNETNIYNDIIIGISQSIINYIHDNLLSATILPSIIQLIYVITSTNEQKQQFIDSIYNINNIDIPFNSVLDFLQNTYQLPHNILIDITNNIVNV